MAIGRWVVPLVLLTAFGMLASPATTAVEIPEEIVFAVRQPGFDPHWYANFGYYAPDRKRKTYRALGSLRKLNTRTGEVTVLIDDAAGTVRDPVVSYDGAKILFSYRKGAEEHFHLYEMNAAGGNVASSPATSNTTTRPGRSRTAAFSTRAGDTWTVARWTITTSGA